MRRAVFLSAWAMALLVSASAATAQAQTSVPLPDAPVRVIIPDPGAFDAALTGAFRRALNGTPAETDPVARAWRQTQVGSKLEDQWSKLSGDLPWTWEEIRKLRPRAIGLALLEVGHLEAVVVIDTPLAALAPPAGTSKTHGGATYQLVTPGAADGSSDTTRRMGLAWARLGDRLFLATSERALLLALDEALAGRSVQPFLPGLASLELDLEALRKDRYFRREFLFAEGPETGRVRAALRLENGQMVEVREGAGEPRPSGYLFDVPAAAALGWEPDGEPLWPTLRSALVEPLPVLADEPVPAVAPLPPAMRQTQEDRYAVNLTRPLLEQGRQVWEAGELARWSALWAAQPVHGWGYWLTADGGRRVVFAWPEARDTELVELARATVERHSGRAVVARVGDVREVRVGPDLPMVALRRVGGFMWIGRSAAELAAAPVPRPDAEIVRWGRVDLAAVRNEAGRWGRAEGPSTPETVRPLSDRILGVLGWIPATTSLSVERRKTSAGWTERVVFGTTR